jgi:flagellar hook-length control protein FliK
VARLEAETDVARAAIVDNLPALRERLAEQGVRIERFDVDLMQRHMGGSADQSDQRQMNESPGAARVALPQRRAVEPAAVVVNVSRPATQGGLNVIV